MFEKLSAVFSSFIPNSAVSRLARGEHRISMSEVKHRYPHFNPKEHNVDDTIKVTESTNQIRFRLRDPPKHGYYIRVIGGAGADRQELIAYPTDKAKADKTIAVHYQKDYLTKKYA